MAGSEPTTSEFTGFSLVADSTAGKRKQLENISRQAIMGNMEKPKNKFFCILTETIFTPHTI
jgi:hypothetical protein